MKEMQPAVSISKKRNAMVSGAFRGIRTNKGPVVTFFIIFVASVLVRQIWLFSVIERDEGGIALVSLQWIHGLLPYVNSVNNAGPLAYLIYLGSTLLFGISFIPVRMVNNLVFYSSMIPFYLCAKDWLNRRSALISSLFYGLFMSAPIYEGSLALTSSVSAPIIVFCVFFCNRYVKSASKKALLVSAFLAGVAIMIKVLVAPILILLLAAVVLRYLRSDQHDIRGRELQKDVLTALLGLCALPAFFLIYFAYQGALGNLITVFFNLSLEGHLASSNVPIGIFWFVVLQGLPLWIFAFLGAIQSVLLRLRISLLLIVWTVFGIAVALFPPNFGHRYIYLVAPAAILAAIGVERIIDGLRNGWRKRPDRKLIFSFFAITLLIMSSGVAVVAQGEQYPQYQINSHFFNFQWLYADSVSYSTQIRLAEFLKSNCAPNDSILVHGWSSEIYYLADKLPPLPRYAWSLNTSSNGVPENEYDKLVEMVNNQQFKFIVFFDNSRDALENRRNDPVVDQTLDRYFYYGNIDNALIFSKYDSQGRVVYYNFIENFSSASNVYQTENGTTRSLEEDFGNDSVYIPKIYEPSIQGDRRQSIFQHPLTSGESEIIYNVSIRENTVLEFGIGMDPSVWNKTGDGVEFVIQVGVGNITQSLWSHYINPKNVSEDRKWEDFEVDLGAYAGTEARIVFATLPGLKNDNSYDWALWADPVLVAENS